MTHRNAPILVALVLTALTATPAAASRIAGLVVDDRGEPVAGAGVVAAPTPALQTIETPWTTTTGTDGRFELDLPDGQAVRLRAVLDRYEPSEDLPIGTDGVSDAILVLIRHGMIFGRVVDENGEPMAEPRVRVSSRRGGHTQIRRTTGDEDGRFGIQVRAGTFHVAATADGFTYTRLEGTRAPGGLGDELSIVLRRGTTLGGFVLDSDGEPLAGAEVSIVATDPELDLPDSLLELWSTTTDARGEYFVRGAGSGRMELLATHDALHGEARRHIDVHPDETSHRVDLQFGGRHTLQGVVRGPDGAPLEGASIKVRDRWLRLSTETRSGADGTFRFDDLPVGELVLETSIDGLASRRTRVELADAAPAALEIQLQNPSSVFGRLTGLNPEDYAHATVSHGGIRARVAPDGTYRLDALPLETHFKLVAQSAHRRREHQTFLVPGVEQRIDFDFAPGIGLSGVIEAPDDLMLRVEAVQKRTTRTARVSRAGRFELEDLAPGPVRLRVLGERGQTFHQQELSLPSERSIEIELQVARVEGRVVDGGSTEPIAGGWVAFWRAEQAWSNRRAGPADPSTDAEGRFALWLPASEPQVLFVSREGFVPHEQTLDLEAGSRLPLEISMQRAPPLRILLAGTAPPELDVGVLDEAGRQLDALKLPVIDGVATLRSLGPHAARLVVGGEGLGARVLEIPGDSRELRARLEPAARLEIVLPQRSLAEFERARVHLVGPDGPLLRIARGGQVADGPLRLGPHVLTLWLAPGRWRALATGPRQQRWQGTVSLEAGGAATLTLRPTKRLETPP
ncbi:MAG: carboxypeptidase-like regulatory domain-containing protein [Acidobacteriota bacterium]